jgi:tetratricopeptide (TPR) repeat protein
MVMNAPRQTIGSGTLRMVATVCWLGMAAVGLAAEPSAPAEKPAASAPAEKRIDQLIAELGNKDFNVRQRAQDELAKRGFQAFDALNAASNHPDFEIASRARYLLRLIRSQWTTDKDSPRARKLLEGYELLPAEERAVRITRLVFLPDGGGIAVVCRLICFEKSGLLANHAALEILRHEPLDRAGWTRLTKTLRENLAGSQRRPAQWLLTYIVLRDTPGTAVETWSKLVKEEEETLRAHPEQTARGAAIMLTYLLAEARARLGDQAAADRTVEHARRLGGGGDQFQLNVRLQTASALRRRGLIPWAEAEYRRAAEFGSVVYKVAALVYLSEMLHDQGRSLQAAEARNEASKTLRQMPSPAREQSREALVESRLDPADVTARMNYFYACHWEQQGDRTKQRQYLEEAIKSNPFEVDTLIALGRLPNLSEADQKKIRQRIDKAAEMLRRDIDEEPDEANAYNQAAWLIGNTRGNLDEALRFGKKAVELDPDNGAYLDTLAHVYFAKGDLDNAVRYQSRAAEVEPHSGQIVSELKAFRAAAEKEKGKKNEKPSSLPDRKG